jgi:hypothetical protein
MDKDTDGRAVSGFLNRDALAYTNGIVVPAGLYYKRFESDWTRQHFRTIHLLNPADADEATPSSAADSLLYPFDRCDSVVYCGI